MALTKEQRDALPDSEFAVPGKRALPIHDKDHVRMAWSMLDHTKDLTDSEKSEAKRRILKKAESLGMDTSGWGAHQGARLEMQPSGENDGGKIQAFHFEAMSLEVPEVKDHPNRSPFSGILTRIDEPSDNPVGGANGKRVLIPKAVAEAALASLLGMGVDYKPSLDGHDAQNKIGVITEATIEGDAIHIKGFLYGSDFPAAVSEIRKQKRKLGFSYEAQAAVADWKADPVEVTTCIFTGAAILKKDKAAYTSTSLEAYASSLEIEKMDIKELLEAVKAAVKEETAGLVKDVAELKASTGKIEAASVLSKVKKHADAIRAAADGMEAEGMGGHERRGHVAVLRRMADKMEAEAVMGKLPHIWNDHDWSDAAAADLKSKVDELTKENAELKAKGFSAAAAPTKPTDEAQAATKAALSAEAESVDYTKLDAQMVEKGASIHQRLVAITLGKMGTAATKH